MTIQNEGTCTDFIKDTMQNLTRAHEGMEGLRKPLQEIDYLLISETPSYLDNGYDRGNLLSAMECLTQYANIQLEAMSSRHGIDMLQAMDGSDAHCSLQS